MKIKPETLKKIDKMVHDHTKKCLFEWCDHGHGADPSSAIRSAINIIRFVEDMVKELEQ